MLNIDLLDRVEDVIVTDPEHWKQNVWGEAREGEPNEDGTACGTVHCIGGWAAILSGKAVLRTSRSLYGGFNAEWRTPDGEYLDRDIKSIARRELGLTEGQAESIFYDFDDDPQHFVERFNELRAEAWGVKVEDVPAIRALRKGRQDQAAVITEAITLAYGEKAAV